MKVNIYIYINIFQNLHQMALAVLQYVNVDVLKTFPMTSSRFHIFKIKNVHLLLNNNSNI